MPPDPVTTIAIVVAITSNCNISYDATYYCVITQPLLSALRAYTNLFRLSRVDSATCREFGNAPTVMPTLRTSKSTIITDMDNHRTNDWAGCPRRVPQLICAL